jgi:type IV secretion system protein VirB9
MAPYSPDEVYRLYGFVGYDIGLEFEKDETFRRVNGGDLKALTYSAQDNTFTFKPRVRTVKTNLTVTTNKRSYVIQYSATDREPDQAEEPVIYVVRFVYPARSTPSDSTPQERMESDLAQASLTRPRNDDYWYCGRPDLKPAAASDDGVHTRFTFAPRAELPAIFLRNEDGSESLVNFTVTAGDIIVHRVAKQWVLRRGRLTGCIVNRSFTGGGERLESGTVSRDVERASRAPRP